MKVYRCLPLFSLSGYATLMKTVPSTLKFECSDPAKFRLKVINHASLYGWRSARDAYRVGRSTIFLWKKKFKESDKRLVSLIPQSTKPKRTRQMVIDNRILSFLKAIRDTYGNIGKEKLKLLTDAYARELGIVPYGATKIGKILRRYHLRSPTKRTRRYRMKPSVIRRKYAPKGMTPGYLELDGLTIYFQGETHRFISIIDTATRMAGCQHVRTLSAENTLKTLHCFASRFPYRIHTIQTDNGSEFLGKFHEELESQNITHEFCYPRCPRINGIVERFNRTMQEECINRIIDRMVNLTDFTNRLESYLIWYNEKRPHYALKYIAPLDYAQRLKEGGHL